MTILALLVAVWSLGLLWFLYAWSGEPPAQVCPYLERDGSVSRLFCDNCRKNDPPCGLRDV